LIQIFPNTNYNSLPLDLIYSLFLQLVDEALRSYEEKASSVASATQSESMAGEAAVDPDPVMPDDCPVALSQSVQTDPLPSHERIKHLTRTGIG
jgi:hypothetical protein